MSLPIVRAEPGLSLECVDIRLGDRALIADLYLTVPPGSIVTVMGPSGCGKSTLLAFITGTLDAAFSSSGRVTLDGMDLSGCAPEHRRIGIQFQDDLLFPHLSVAGNLAFGLRPEVRGRDERRLRVGAALADADLAGFESRDPTTLSGGQRARIALMRTLLAEPRALLLDEPFNRLDARLRAEMRAFVFGHVARRGLPTLLVTHDPADARAAGGPVIEFGAR